MAYAVRGYVMILGVIRIIVNSLRYNLKTKGIKGLSEAYNNGQL